MADMKDDGFNPDKIAEALNKAAEEWKPSKLTLKDKLGEPKVLEAIKNFKRRGASGREITEILAGLGIKTTPQTLNSMIGKIEREARGDGDTKQRRERKATKPSEVAGTSSEATSGSAKSSESKPDSKPARTEERKLNKTPSMGGAFDTDNL